jgi:hypothetical protein
MRLLMVGLALLLQDKTSLKLQPQAGTTWKFEQSNKVTWGFDKIDEASKKQLEESYKAQFKNFALTDKIVMDFETSRSGEGKVDKAGKGVAQFSLKIAKAQIKGKYFGNVLDSTFDSPDQKLPDQIDEGVRDVLTELKKPIGNELHLQSDASGRLNGKDHFVFGALPENPIEVGEKWDHVSTSTLDPLGVEVEIKATTTLVSVEKDVAMLETTIKIGLKNGQPENGDPKFTVDGGGSGKAQIDVKSGRILSASTAYDIKVGLTGTNPETKAPMDMQMFYKFEQGERNTY